MQEKLDFYEEKMNKSLDALQSEYGSIRAGRANPHVLDKIKVDYYGTPTPIQQVGNISVPEARMIVIQPCEKSLLKAIEKAIKTMPNYFADYDTTVHFISEEEMRRDHSRIPHGGFVLRSGVTGWEKENRHLIEYSLKLDSNPEFTSSVIAAYARAACRLSREGNTGCKTVFDIAPAYLSARSGEELRASLL